MASRRERAGVYGGGDLTADMGVFGLQVTDTRVKPVWAKVTGGASGTNRYSWTQTDDTDSTFPDAPAATGMSGTTTVGQWPAYEITGRTDVATGTKVLLWPSPAGSFWVFDSQAGAAAFPAELTSTYSSGYSWKEKTVTSGAWADKSGGRTGTTNAFSIDNNQSLPSGTRGLMVADGAKWAFAPVWRFETRCVSGTLKRQYSTDGGTTWTTIENLGVSCPTATGGASGGPGWVAGLKAVDDCLRLTPISETDACSGIVPQSINLTNAAGASWTGTIDFAYDGGSGPVVFTKTGTMPSLTIDGVYGVYDGAGQDAGGANYIDYAFGGSLCTGTHVVCGDNVFRVRITCQTCPEISCCGLPEADLPDDLYLTLANDSNCPDAAGVVIKISRAVPGAGTSWNYDSIEAGTGDCATSVTSVSFNCSTGTMTLSWGADEITSNLAVLDYQCGPPIYGLFRLDVTNGSGPVCCAGAGSILVTLTETPP